MNRRQFSQGALAMTTGVLASGAEAALDEKLGITTSSLDRHLGPPGSRDKISILDLPQVMNEELGMSILDLNTNTLARLPREKYDQFRANADRYGCVITNLKMNQKGLDMNHPDPKVRERALAIYKKSISDAARIGARWARPLPLPQRPEMAIHVDSYRRLAEFAATRGIRMLVENYGWMESDPDSVVNLIKEVDHNLAASPDTGNWKDDAVRFAGLEKTFPAAVTCDFKARALGPDGEHAAYDLKRCFDIGWKAGFRGPWCLEHAHSDRARLFEELILLKEGLLKWMAAS